MSFEHDIRRIWRSDLSVEAKAVLTAIRHHGGDDGACRVSADKIAQIASLGRATVFKRIAEMVEAGNLVKVEKGTYRIPESLCGRPEKSPVETGKVSAGDSKVSAGDSKVSAGDSKVSAGDFSSLHGRQPPTPPLEVLSSYDVNATHAPVHVHTREAASTPTSGTSTPTSGTSTPTSGTSTPTSAASTPTSGTSTPTRPDIADNPVEAILRGHPMAERLRPYVEVCLSILGTTPDIFTAESWLARGYSLARVRFGLGQARQAMGPGAPAGRVIVSAGNWMLRAEKHEYAHLEPKPVETPPAETTRREMTPEERAAALAKLDALLDDMPRRDGPSREGCA